MFVVVADDAHGEALARLLRVLRPDWIVRGVTCAEDLDRLLDQATPDVVVLDILGLGDDCLALARLPRGRTHTATRILLASGLGDLPEIAAREGLPYLQKPFTAEDLAAAVAGLVDLDASTGG